jgi:putative membrane-bound dehydrogenase-like protein
MRRTLLKLVLAIIPVALSAPDLLADRPGGFTPEEAIARMVIPDGFRVEVFASEPMVRQPLSATFDERGRLWVIEYLQYPNPAGLKPVSVDRYLRTEYDRVPEPPPHGPRGADRIKILEDTDGDGKADKATVFVEGLNLASGLAVGHGGVFVGQAPYLLFYPDRDRDDHPDGDPEVLLKGFGLQDAHSTVNSMSWGPDGWLYGAQGSTVTARIQGIEFQQGIWRYHPRTRRFELFAEGGGNTWGLDYDAAGNIFGSSNGNYITFHMEQGAYYLKGFAKHGPLHNPHTFGYFGPIAYDGAKVGGHVTPGGIIYKGDAFPPEFQGAFIGGNLLSNSVYWHTIKPSGSTFQGKHGGTLIDARDTWFRPIDLLVGPDAAVYVVDWYDKRAAHLDPRDTWDRTNGRIYRVVHGERRKVEPFDLNAKSSAELVELRTSPNDWYAAEARRILAERRDPSVIPGLKDRLRQDRDETIALRDLWALQVSGGFDDSQALESLEHPVAGVRRWTVRFLGDDGAISQSLKSSLVALAAAEPSASVRAQLASSCQRWKSDDAIPILDRLARHEEDRDDAHIPLMIWWAVERQLRNDRNAVVEWLANPDAQTSPIIGTTVLERAARALASGGTTDDYALYARLLEASPERAQADRVMAGIEQALDGRALETVPPPLRRSLDRFWASGSQPDPALVRFAARLGSAEAIAVAMRTAGDESARETHRIAMIGMLGQMDRPEVLPALSGLYRKERRASILAALLSALGARQPDSAAELILSRYGDLTASVRDQALGVLCSRPGWARELIAAIAAKKVSPRDLRPNHILQIVQLQDPALLKEFERVWGKIPRAGSPEKTRRIAEVRGLLPEGDKGNAARGKAVFQETCAGCHRLFDHGESFGPELTGADRGNLDFLLTSLVDPGSQIRKEFQGQTLALRDGRVLSGLIVEENDRSVTIFDSSKRKTLIPRDEIEEMRPMETSVMPEGILDNIPEPKIRDLFRYLQSNGKF